MFLIMEKIYEFPNNNFLQKKCAFEIIKLHFEERQSFEVIFKGDDIILILK